MKVALSALVLLGGSSALAQAPIKRNILILNEVGLSHSITNIMSQQIVNGVQEIPDRHVEFFSESLDLISFPDKPSPLETRDWLNRKYNGYKVDVVVAVGPGAVKFLAKYTQSMFLNVPIVISGSAEDQAGYPKLDYRFTGTWQKREPLKTVQVALRLFPGTKHVFVVAGTSSHDQVLLSATKEAFQSFPQNVDFTYLANLGMNRLLGQIQHLPEHSIVLYLSFFQDAQGNKFVNATKALPLIAQAANAPVFGMSDTYLGHGIIGGDVMSFQEQGKRTAQIVSELLDGKMVEDFAIETLPSQYMFDWNELQRWHLSERRLPAESVILFREPSLWERTKWLWIASSLIILSLSALVVYLQHSRKQLKLARERQRQLSGLLINAGEQERSRLAAELHDDFSQRLAVIALKLENVAEIVSPMSPEADEELHELLNSTSELGADLHTLSHRLHSATLESLGLVPALTSLCKEASSQQGIQVHLRSDNVPRSISPDVALCIFRIVQEALRNFRKHSGVNEARVELRQTHNGLEVSVRDEGGGFDLAELQENEGLGIRSMRERARSLEGEFDIQSSPGRGTAVHAWVPLASRVAVEQHRR